MRTLNTLVLILAWSSGCVDGDKADTALPDEDKEVLANLACAAYTPSVVRAIEGRCGDQMTATWGEVTVELEEDILAKWTAWEDAAAVQVQRDCVDYLLSAPDFDSARYVVGGVCYYGYSHAHYDDWSAATCEDWVEDMAAFKPAYPYTEYCPCLTSGAWHTEGPDDRAECGAGHEPD